MRPKSDIGTRIRELREERGMSVTALAKEAGIDRTTLSRVEHGHHTPSFANVENIARALAVEPGRLFAPPPPKAPPPRTMAELLDVAGVEGRELERPYDKNEPGHLGELFEEDLSYEETIALARRVIEARRAVEAVVNRYLEDPDTSPQEKIALQTLFGQAVISNSIAITAVHIAAEKEIEEARRRGDDVRIEEVADERRRLMARVG